ncbi:MAG: cyclic nucleotide-binding domain-containing protein [Acetobacteraceae bacterium]
MSGPDGIAAALAGMPMLRGLPDEILAALAAVAGPLEVAAGTVLCREGKPPIALHLLLSGQVSLSGRAADGSAAVVDVVRPGGRFILAAVLTGRAYLMTARAVTPARLLRLPAAELCALAATRPALGMALARAVARDFRAMVLQVRDLKLRSLPQRLAYYLLQQAPAGAAAPVALRLPFDKALLAARLGCRPANLSRAFAVLRALGVETHGARVVLHDPPRLWDFAAPDLATDTEAVGAAADR